MNTGIHIGNKENTSNIEATTKAITTILRTARDTHTEQSTIVAALSTLGEVARVQNITVEGSTISGDKVVNMDPPAPRSSEKDPF